MAQLNPNFEIDFSDINSYEQIQLINDTQLAKENLLMHRAYKEPSDDEIIRNHFSSFTFVDFCPKLLSAQRVSNVGLNQQQQVFEQFNSSSKDRVQSPTGSSPPPSSSLRLYYELETFSDLFQRINNWLKLNKDWRVVSMETLVYDCTSQFNHLKSSIHSAHLPQNTRGLRLFLSPSKSRFSGPQKIGCINVVPRKLTGSHLSPQANNSAPDETSQQQEAVTYETLDDILQRLNELLLTRPIEGRILSVETITLPMVNGYVNTESNYYVDSRLNLLSQSAYNLAAGHSRRHSSVPASTDFRNQQQQQTGASMLIADPSLHGHTLIDILRVYYEFGPMVCGLVNLIDFVPRFYTPTPVQQAGATEPSETVTQSSVDNNNRQLLLSNTGNSAETSVGAGSGKQREKIAATESLTRLIRRSLAWFEVERKRILSETGSNLDGSSSSSSCSSSTSSSAESGSSNNGKKNAVNLKLCNLQVHQKTLLKSQLVQVNTHSPCNAGSCANNVAQIISTRTMAHPRPQQPLSCAQCNLSTDKDPVQNWCLHLKDLSQAYQVKFVRLAYIVPVFNKYARPVCPLRPLRRAEQQAANVAGSSAAASSDQTAAAVARGSRQTTPTTTSHPSSDSSSASSTPSPNSSPFLLSQHARRTATRTNEEELPSSDLLGATTDWPAYHESGQPNGQLVTTAEHQQSFPPPIPEFGPNESGPVNNNRLATIASIAHVRSESAGSIASSASSYGGVENLSSSSSGDAPAHLDDEDKHRLKEFLLNQGKAEESAKQGALEIFRKTNERHQKDEQAHQLKQKGDDGLNDSPIGQLTYRLFAPCQLVNSSSCFSINPVNSSSPLARRGSVDLNGSGISSENANPSTLLLGNSSSTSSLSYQHNESSMSSFGAFFPNLAHDFMHPGGAGTASSGLGCSDVSPSSKSSSLAAAASSSTSSSSGQLSANSRFTTNEFEPVEAIKRRMEIYVTTNSMKVVAGETLIVNLSDVLSCLSTAIEQTVVKAPFAQRAPSTWVSVYVLYAAVEEPQLPSQLLAQQRLRDLTLIDEETGEEEKDAAAATAAGDEMTAECYFDDDFKGSLDISGPTTATTNTNQEQKGQQKTAAAVETVTTVTKSESATSAAKVSGNSIRIEQNPGNSSLTLYNSAYDRTVALPTPPDNQQDELVKPIEFLGSQADCLWLNESDLIEAQTRQQQQASMGQFEASRKARKGRKAKSRKHDDSQCSIM